jgi:anti-sigma B factor antagonist
MAVARYPSGDDLAGEDEDAPVVRREGARTVVALHGEQDMSTAPDLAEALAAASNSGEGDVVVDLSEVQFLDSAIITELARGRDVLRSQSRALMLRAPSKFALRLLEVCGLVGPTVRSRRPVGMRSVLLDR